MNIKKVYDLLEREKSKDNSRRPDEILWQFAICRTLIGDIQEAFSLYKKSFFAMLKPPMLWSLSAQPNLLVEIYFLSCEFENKKDVINHLIEFRKNNRIGDNLYAHTAYGLMGLQYPELNWTMESVVRLTDDCSIKDKFFIGNCIQSIEQNNQTKLTLSLLELLGAHKSMATKGSLRGTPEGWLCLPAMVLIYLAKLRGMKTIIDNVYVSQAYIDFIISL